LHSYKGKFSTNIQHGGILNSIDLLNRSAVFKKCPLCEFEWNLRVDFLRDPNINIMEYRVDHEDLAGGLFLFDHSCRGTLAIPVEDFEDLYDGPIFVGRATGGKECPGYCLRQDELRPCPTQCECAYVREIISLIKHWTKD